MTNLTLSVVLPNYNHSQYLPKALTALVKRDRPPDEVILIDDGSTDNSWEIIQDFARRYPCIRPYRNDRNRGVEFTVDRALQLAQGDYFYGAAADDYVGPGFFEKSMALLARYPQAGLSCTIGDWHELDTGLNWHMGVGMTNEPAYLSPQRMSELERAGRLFIPGHTVIVKRSALLEMGKFPAEVKYAGDWFTFNLVGFRYGICVVPEPLAVFQMHPNTFYRRGRRNKETDGEVMEAIVRLLSQPQFRDAVELMRISGTLFIWGYPMLKFLVSHREYHRFLTSSFLRKNLWHTAKLAGKRWLPAGVAKWYIRLGGYRAQTFGVTPS